MNTEVSLGKHFPSEVRHRQRWRNLARAIAAQADDVSESPGPAKAQGELVVLGSGIEAVGFTSSDEMYIREADEVFYCVADPATVVWLKTLCPDAYDLYVLYDESKPRYLTYVQMSEVMLHYVRAGRKVVAIFYGHPGIFVLSTHRAIRIARREGYSAVMRPGISALDTLCADLGVDPSQPGMQMYEATDMLIRRRRPDPGLHLVLWQVGLIGKLGYRRQGYINNNFSVLLDYLEAIYGAEHPVINYVGSRYPGVEPLVDRQTIASLRNPATQVRVTGISTFYLPPKDAAASDPQMLEQLGLIAPGQRVRPTESPLRVIDRYGQRERAAFADFATFDVPASYHWQEDTSAARFILDLREDGELRDRYRRDPSDAVASWSGVLSDHDRRLLSHRDAGAMQIAAKGLRTTADPENQRLLLHLLSRKTATSKLRKTLRRAHRGEELAAVKQWTGALGFTADWRRLSDDLERLLRDDLYPWAGLYLAGKQELSLSIHCRPGSPQTYRVDLNGHRLDGIRFHKGVLTWSTEAGNSCSGHLRAALTTRGGRRLVGVVWPAGAAPASEHAVVAIEQVMRPRLPVCMIAGCYRHRGVDGHERIIAIESVSDGAGPHMRVTVDGQPTDQAITVAAGGFHLGEEVVPLSTKLDEVWPAVHLHERYRVLVVRGPDARLVSLELGPGTMSVDGDAVAELSRDGSDIRWQGGPTALPQGRLSTIVDPISLHPMLFGEAELAGGAAALRGIVPVSEAQRSRLASAPRCGVPSWAWLHVCEIVSAASHKGGLFLWHSWERASTNLRRVRATLDELRERS